MVEFSNRHAVLARWVDLDLEGGQTVDLRIEYWDLRAGAMVQLVWTRPNPGLREQALEVAAQADVIVLMMGLSPRLEGEEMRVEVPGFAGGDRIDIGLPVPQEELIQAVKDLDREPAPVPAASRPPADTADGAGGIRQEASEAEGAA